jgi:hypothetical protein
MKILLNLTGILLVLAIMYLISWKKKNISVKMLVKAVIAQFLIAVILVKVPAGRYVVSRVSDAVTSVINCGQDGLSFTGRQHGCHRIRFCHTGPGQHCIPVCPGKSSLLYRNSGICGKMDW